MDRWSLSGCCIVVTGGTKGIGRSVVYGVLAKGASPVVFCSRRLDDTAVDVLEDLRTEFPTAVLHHIACDVAEEVGRKCLVDFCRENVPFVHGLVNNVGTNIRKSVLEQEAVDYSTMMQTNLDSAYFLCRDFFSLFREGSSIVNVSSAAGVQSSGTGVCYAMSKAGLNQLSRALSCEWAAHGIRVNSVTPWMTMTPLLQQSSGQDTDKACQATPLGRLATPIEVADPITFLLLPAASYVTGQVWGIDGGLTAQGFAGPCIATPQS